MKEVDFFPKELSEKLISSTKSLKYKTIYVLMLDAGLRVTETITLKIENFDFKDRIIYVYSLKKRKSEKGKVKRQIPITDRLYEVLFDYLKTFPKIEGEMWLFPSDQGDEPYLSRKSVWKSLQTFKEKNPEFSNTKLFPHKFRHTFATELVTSGTPLHEAQKMLGHANINTTTIYTHLPIEVSRRRLGIAKPEKRSFWQNLRRLIKPKKEIVINITSPHEFTVGRKKELEILTENAAKGINTIILGSVGVGKSHLLRSLSKSQKMILIDDMTDIKQTLIGVILYLVSGEKKTLKALIYPNYGEKELQKHLTKQSVKSLTTEIVKLTNKGEYTLLIDSVDRITPKAVSTIEFLKDHFCIITSAREVPISKSSFLWNFDRISLKPLDRLQSLEMIGKLSYELKVPDFEMYQNHIFENTAGNPRAIFEMVERYKKEPFLTSDAIKAITHTGALREIDMTGVILIVLGSFVILRYLGSETGEDSLKFIGGVALVLLILARYFLRFTKRKFV